MFRFLARDLGIDLGTANTLIYVRGKGICLNEPSFVAIQEGPKGEEVIAFGTEAKKMLGKTPRGVRVQQPIKDGAVSNFGTARVMLEHFIRQVIGKGASLVKPRIVIGVPSGLTELEKRAVRELGNGLGGREVRMIDEAMAAAIGCGLPISLATGSLIVDIGGGTTDVAVISYRDVIYGKSIRVGGDAMDEAIIQGIRKLHKLLIGPTTAELVKITLGSAVPKGDEQQVEVRGRAASEGYPASAILTGQDVRLSLEPVVLEIIKAIRVALESVPPEISADLLESGIHLTGGGALLRGIDARLREEFRLNVSVAEDPLTAVVLGAGKCLDDETLFRDICF